MEQPEIRIEWFCLHKWFDLLKNFKDDFQFRVKNEFHVIKAEMGFYYVLSSYTDLATLREALYYTLYLYCHKTGFDNFDKLIAKNVKLLLYKYEDTARNLQVPIEPRFNDMEIIPFLKERESVRNELWGSPIRVLDGAVEDLRSILFGDPLELPWRLVITYRTYELGATIITENIEQIFSDIILGKDRKHDYANAKNYIQKLETLGADFAFYSRILTPKMAELFMRPFQEGKPNGWHNNYCENILSRLILPILNLNLAKPTNIDLESFQTMLLIFIKNYRKVNTLVMFDTQLEKALALFGHDTEQRNKFESALRDLNWSGNSVDLYPWKNESKW